MIYFCRYCHKELYPRAPEMALSINLYFKCFECGATYQLYEALDSTALPTLIEIQKPSRMEHTCNMSDPTQ